MPSLAEALRKLNVGGLQDYQYRTPEEQDAAGSASVLARDSAPNDAETQNPLAMEEHKEFARDISSNLGPLGYATSLAAVPAYELAKKLGIMSGRSDPSVESAAEGYRGANAGLADWLRRVGARG